MDVALDANILIADLWLRSQRIRQILDYLVKTRSVAILHHVVEAEVRAHIHRSIAEDVARTVKTLKDAANRGVIGLPDIDGESIRDGTIQAWEKQFARVFHPGNTRRLQLDGDDLPEAIRRATGRIKPCSDTGDGLRDTLIWLGLIGQAAKNRDEGIAFISLNTKDFADAGKAGLHTVLLKDCTDRGARIDYFPDVDTFLRNHAEPVSFVTGAWVSERLDMRAVEEVIARDIDVWGRGLAYSPIGWFGYGLLPVETSLRNYYRPTGRPEIVSVVADFDDVFVWKFDDQRIELRLVFNVSIEAEVECARVREPSIYDLE